MVFLFFCRRGLFKDVFEYIVLYHFTWSLGNILAFVRTGEDF